MTEALDIANAGVLAPQHARFQHLSRRNAKRNFRLGVTNGVLYGLGIYFVSKSTIIPSFFSHLTSSSALIGFVSQFEAIGWYLPQFFIAGFVAHQARKMPLYRIMTVLRGLSFFTLAFITIFDPNPTLLLLLGILFYGLLSSGGGICGPVFLDLVAKTIPFEKRGRFFGLRASIGSLLSATIGAVLISFILSSKTFPQNFGYVFLIGAIIATAGLICMAIMREPRSLTVPDQRNPIEQLKLGWQIYKSDARFSTYAKTRLVMSTWTIGVPFLVLFAHDKLGYETGELGIFIAADCLGVIAGSFFWERLTDRRSAKACLEATAILSVILPTIILLFLWLPVPKIIYPIVFALASAVDAGTSVGGLTYLIEICPDHDRATYIGLFNSLMALPCFLAAVAGALLDIAGYGVVYSIILALGIASLVGVSRLEHIQKRRNAVATS